MSELLDNLSIIEPWQTFSDCKGEEDTFYPPSISIETNRERSRREAMAKLICSTCMVSPDCLDFALRNDEPEGVWGGTNQDERFRIRYNQP
jgi:WhiB family redox-sensing transcriptional regulator